MKPYTKTPSPRKTGTHNDDIRTPETDSIIINYKLNSTTNSGLTLMKGLLTRKSLKLPLGHFVFYFYFYSDCQNKCCENF